MALRNYLLTVLVYGWALSSIEALTCPPSYTPIGTFCLLAGQTEGSTNDQAEQSCTYYNGSLPTFANAQEADTFRSVASSVSGENPWVGYYNSQSHSAANPGVWLDPNSVSCPYTSWATGEPNNNGGVESCAVMVINGTSYTMQDVACSLTRAIVFCTARPTALPACSSQPGNPQPVPQPAAASTDIYASEIPETPSSNGNPGSGGTGTGTGGSVSSGPNLLIPVVVLGILVVALAVATSVLGWRVWKKKVGKAKIASEKTSAPYLNTLTVT